MSPIIELQRSIVEAGRIRIGHQVPTQKGGRRPAKLETFRLTSADRRRIDQAAELYGGTVAAWDAPAGKQWEVITERSELDVVVPPERLSFSQNYELWSAGGCQRRCDGVTETIGEQPCVCDPAERECDIHTRLSILLRDLPGLGVWRIDTQGWYAATELRGALEIIGMAAGTRLLPARLRLDQRTVKRPDANGKPQTFRFAVPVLDVEVTPALLLAGGQGQPLELAAAPKTMTPVPALESGEGPTIAEQSAAPAEKPKRANAAPPIPRSGRRRAAADTEQPAGTPADGEEPEASRAREQGGRDADAAPAGGPEPAAASTETSTAGGSSARPRAAKADENYWQARLHACAADHGIDHDGLRLIGAAVKRQPADQLDDFSMRDLSDQALEGIDKLLRSFSAQVDVDGATEWVAKIAEAHGLADAAGDADWSQVDPIATAAMAVPLDEAGVAEWIAFGLRLHAGEYDASEPEPEKKARPRRAQKES